MEVAVPFGTLDYLYMSSRDVAADVRVVDLAAQQARLKAAGVDGWRLELPMGPAFSWTAPGGQRVAIYEPTRVGIVDHFEGRHDF